jgi:DHA2 family multidrug resistance protein
MVHRTEKAAQGAEPLSTDAAPDDYPENLDAGLLKIAGACVLAAVMAILDTTVVSVAQRTFITEFETTQAVVAWTMTAYTLALATVIPLTGWAADRFGTKRLFMRSVLFFTVGSLLNRRTGSGPDVRWWLSGHPSCPRHR